jgi:hypothetical protein
MPLEAIRAIALKTSRLAPQVTRVKLLPETKNLRRRAAQRLSPAMTLRLEDRTPEGVLSLAHQVEVLR